MNETGLVLVNATGAPSLWGGTGLWAAILSLVIMVVIAAVIAFVNRGPGRGS